LKEKQYFKISRVQTLKVPTIREEITKFSVKYRDKMTKHAKELASTLLEEEEEPRRLEIFKPTDLKTRFL